jgi:hypothetical protein
MMDKNHQPENSSILGFGEVPENLDPAVSPIPQLRTPIPASNAREGTIFSPEHSCILTMGWTLPPEWTPGGQESRGRFPLSSAWSWSQIGDEDFGLGWVEGLMNCQGREWSNWFRRT